MKVLGLSCSPRGGTIKGERLSSIIKQCKYNDEITRTIYDLGNNKKICNSEALLMSAMYGVTEEKVGFDIVHLNKTRCDEIDIDKYKGLIVASPVYFGDRSSLAENFINTFQQKSNHSFSNKVVGVVSSGAKRNGGQETTIVYMLSDFLNRGAIIVGNGPPTAQYGGTGWGGNIGSIIDDDFGLKTSKGTGYQVAKLVKTISTSDISLDNQIRILFLITKNSKDKVYANIIKHLPFSNSVNLDICDITESKIKSCLACPICPNGNIDEKYTCIIQNDDIAEIHNRITSADCIVISSYDGSSLQTKDVFQSFIERTRFIRRNHFELSNKLFSYFGYTKSILDIKPFRIMSSFLRHNMFSIGPYYVRLSDKFETIKKQDYTKRLEKMTVLSKTYRSINNIDNEYTPVGYEDAGHEKEMAYRD